MIFHLFSSVSLSPQHTCFYTHTHPHALMVGMASSTLIETKKLKTMIVLMAIRHLYFGHVGHKFDVGAGFVFRLGPHKIRKVTTAVCTKWLVSWWNTNGRRGGCEAMRQAWKYIRKIIIPVNQVKRKPSNWNFSLLRELLAAIASLFRIKYDVYQPPTNGYL